MKSPFEAILFDLDGTLLDTAHDLTTAFKKVIPEDEHEHFTLDELKKASGLGSEKFYHLAKERNITLSSYDKFKQQFHSNYLEQNHSQTTLFPEMELVLHELNFNEIPWAIVTNKYHAAALHTVKQFPELTLNSCVVGADTAKYPKPAPEPLLYACKELAVTPENCLFVGDTDTDMEAALHANMPKVAFEHGYGDIDLKRWQVEYTMSKASDLLHIIFPELNHA